MITNSEGACMWTEQDIGDQSGRVALVTGGNSGIGFATARLLRAHGATVVLGCRDEQRAEAAATALEADGPGGPVRILSLDLASLASIRKAASQFEGRLDLLVCNAGVLIASTGRTADGFPVHVGVNHLGHFALTGLLLPRLLATPASRVVVVASLGHRAARLGHDWATRDRGLPVSAYTRSKLANLLFAQELDQRLSAAGAGTRALAAHPGAARTGIVRGSARLSRRLARTDRGWRRHLVGEPDLAALSVVRAATDPTAQGGEFYGPGGPLGLTGMPALTRAAPRVYDRNLQRGVWEVSERLTGVHYPV